MKKNKFHKIKKFDADYIESSNNNIGWGNKDFMISCWMRLVPKNWIITILWKLGKTFKKHWLFGAKCEIDDFEFKIYKGK